MTTPTPIVYTVCPRMFGGRPNASRRSPDPVTEGHFVCFTHFQRQPGRPDMKISEDTEKGTMRGSLTFWTRTVVIWHNPGMSREDAIQAVERVTVWPGTNLFAPYGSLAMDGL